MTHRWQQGFTIVELVIIIVTIGVLASIAAYGFNTYSINARDTQRAADTKALATALERYFEEKGQYPSVATMSTTTTSAVTSLLRVERETLRAPTNNTSGSNSVVNYENYSASTADVYRYRGFGTDLAECRTNTNVEAVNTSGATSAGYCESFILSYRRERDNTWQYVYSRQGTSFH